MKRKFNITGACLPEDHYMVDISGKIAEIFKMVEQGDYFVISRPRQYGKTTVLNMLDRFLQTDSDYLTINISFEGIGEEGFESTPVFLEAFFLLLNQEFKSSGNAELVKFIESSPVQDRMDKLGVWISDLVQTAGKKIVLMIDEVDKSSNNQLFLDFLGMLRNKYLNRKKLGQLTFHSVILAGLHDIKSLKLKLRPESEAKFNSPWNIAVNFKVNLGFSMGEITPMLEDYSKEQGVKLNDPLALAGKIFYYTSGYPFLVSKLCKVIDEDILPLRAVKEWDIDDIDQAVQLTLKDENTNFESLIKNLENNPKLYDFVFNIIMNGAQYMFNPNNPLINFGVLHGILKDGDGKVCVHNRIYEQLIYNYMSSKLETSSKVTFDHFTSKYLDETGRLDIKKVFLKFKDFMKENYNEKDRDFLERNGRLLFLAFIKPIINGRGFDFKEVQISEEKRLDMVITFDNKKYIIELKIWRGKAYHQEGIKQLCSYLDVQNETTGYLLIYDLRKESGLIEKKEIIQKIETIETIEAEGKTIFAAWV
jgi:hypothetical protein